MGTIADMLNGASRDGYVGANATAKVAQDIVLRGIAKSSLSHNVTIKGGVVMRGISKDTRRATRDLDIDFIKYSLGDDSIDAFIEKINSVEGVTIMRYGDIEELSQEDYHGKRIYVRITDTDGDGISSKIDLGIHNRLDIAQEEFCFDIGADDEGVCLLVNSKEQMFTEKLRSLLKFGAASTRFRDIFDMHYLMDKLDVEKLDKCISEYIIDDPGMKENSKPDIYARIERTFRNRTYRRRLASSDRNWLEIDINVALEDLLNFLSKI